MSLEPEALAGAEGPETRPAADGAPPSPAPGGASTDGAASSGSQTTSDSTGRVLWFIERFALVILFVATMIFFTVWSKTSGKFLTAPNIRNVLSSQAVIGILAMAILVPLTCGEFDFSVGSIAGLTQVLCAGFMSRLGWPVGLAILVPVAIGAFVGLSNGNTIARIGVNSLIVTLGVASVLAGIVEWYTSGQSIITNISPTLIKLGSSNWIGIPRPVYYLAGVALLIYYLLEHTPFGRYLQSIGSNADAARLVGLRVDMLVLLAFVISGTVAGFAGVLWVGSTGVGSPQLGNVTQTLQALAAVYLGSTAIKPGRFNVVGTLVAIFFLAFTVNGLSLAGVQSWIQDVFNGAALFVAVLISTILGRRRAGVT